MRAALALLLLAGTAQAQQGPWVSLPHQCGPRSMFVEGLKDGNAEQVIGAGTNEKKFVELWVSQSGSFTVLQSSEGPDGNLVSCIMAFGENWTPLTPPVKGERSS